MWKAPFTQVQLSFFSPGFNEVSAICSMLVWICLNQHVLFFNHIFCWGKSEKGMKPYETLRSKGVIWAIIVWIGVSLCHLQKWLLVKVWNVDVSVLQPGVQDQPTVCDLKNKAAQLMLITICRKRLSYSCCSGGSCGQVQVRSQSNNWIFLELLEYDLFSWL